MAPLNRPTSLACILKFAFVGLLTGSQIYILNGTDPERDPVRYGLTFEKGSTEYFRADPKSGNVTLIQELDREVSLLMKTLDFKPN